MGSTYVEVLLHNPADLEDTPILGATALECLGYQPDPVTKKLKPIELLKV